MGLSHPVATPLSHFTLILLLIKNAMTFSVCAVAWQVFDSKLTFFNLHILIRDAPPWETSSLCWDERKLNRKAKEKKAKVNSMTFWLVKRPANRWATTSALKQAYSFLKHKLDQAGLLGVECHHCFVRPILKTGFKTSLQMRSPKLIRFQSHLLFLLLFVAKKARG